MALFNKKKDDPIAQPAPQQAAPSDIPFEQVNGMKKQGMSDNQIMQTLQRDGYKSYQIYDAMNQAELKPGTPQPMDAPSFDPPPDLYNDVPQQFPEAQTDFSAEPSFGTGELDRIEEVAEAIIDEKWSELMQSIKKIVEWKDNVEAQIAQLQNQIEDLRASVNGINSSLVDKMNEYDRNMSAVGTNIKAMEKVFQKILPAFSENVSELSRITKDLKK